jgi:hypothetical protein
MDLAAAPIWQQCMNPAAVESDAAAHYSEFNDGQVDQERSSPKRFQTFNIWEI